MIAVAAAVAVAANLALLGTVGERSDPVGRLSPRANLAGHGTLPVAERGGPATLPAATDADADGPPEAPAADDSSEPEHDDEGDDD
jgi:hypothetical protein